MRLTINNEKKTIIYLSVFFIAVLIVVFYVILPTIHYIININTDTANLRNYLEKKSDDVHALKISKTKTDEVGSTVKKYQDYLFFHGDELRLINSLENMATFNHLDQKIENSDLGKNLGNTIHISVSTRGSYFDSLHYINDLERGNYFIQIQKILIAPTQELTAEKTDGTLMNIDLLLYVNSR